ncbi:hypothetical protein [Paenimyroides baculatum]|uniref:Uncharacterized protein n=1 Tax=Paenimyroides baculatum TaxID=2608000 RepID=A0A5M6CLZ3_9FLAO|nr:hypothetical protein [Paenimyroides baculatum]KAA5534335.1 hypothetical protein F0460_09515 [Paenimyroides baculatum]
MGVGETLSTPTATNVKLDSMKMYYYDFFSKATPSLPGLTYMYETKESHPPSTLLEIKHYFTYEANGFVDTRTVVLSGFYNTTFTFAFNYDYNDVNELEMSDLVIYKNNEMVHENTLDYSVNDPNESLKYYQYNQYNVTSNSVTDFKTPKNVYNPERNLLPPNIRLQYLNLLDNGVSGFDFGNYYYVVRDLFDNRGFINTHCTFPLQNEYIEHHQPVLLDNIQYKVRQDHYPEIIQYGNVYAGGYRFLYYYKN